MPATDLVTLLEAATEGALDNVMKRLEGRALEARARAQPGAAGAAGGPPNRAQIGAGLEVDLQIAVDPERVVIRADESASAIYGRFAPGFHGLLVDVGGGAPPAVDWPATALAQNLSPRRQVLRLLNDAGLDALDPAPLGRPGGAGLYRFKVLHVARPRAGMPPMLLVRGGELLPGRFVDLPMLRGMAERMARHLSGRFIERQRVRGTYHPASGRYEPELADELEATLASLALMRHARSARRRGGNDPMLGRIENSAAGVVNRVAGRLLTPDDLKDPVICGLAVLTMLDAPAAAFEPALRDRLVGKLVAEVGDAPAAAAGPPPAPAERAVVVAALAGRYAQSRDPALGEALAGALTALWEQADGRFDVYALPWAAEAHAVSASALVEAGLLDAEMAAERSASFARLLELIEMRQVVDRPRLGPADVMGGIVLAPAPEGSPPNPVWQTAQVLRFLATVLDDPQVVPPARRAGVMVTAQAAARFMGQLMMDEPNTFAVPSPPEALGGIRLALYDNTLDIAPTALTLLAVTGLDDALRAMADGRDQA